MNKTLPVIFSLVNNKGLGRRIGYFMFLPQIKDFEGRSKNLESANFYFNDSFDYGNKKHTCGGLNIGGDCLTASLIFDHLIQLNQNNCIEYWGAIVHKKTELKLGHEVYYDLEDGLAGGEILIDTCNLSLQELEELFLLIANRLLKTVSEHMEYKEIDVLDTTNLIHRLETYGIKCYSCSTIFHSLKDYREHTCDTIIKLKEQFEKIGTAKTNDEKKKTLEQFMCLLFDSTEEFSVKSRNARGLDSEIDIMVSNETNNTFLKNLGTPIIIECKNWNKPIGAKEMRDFIVKLQNKAVKTGIIVSKNGITGTKLTEAKGLIRLEVAKKECYLLCLDYDDLNWIVKGMRLIDKIKEKYYEIHKY